MVDYDVNRNSLDPQIETAIQIILMRSLWDTVLAVTVFWLASTSIQSEISIEFDTVID